MRQSKRPHVICHMASSVDGRIVTAPWKLPSSLMARYEQTAATFRASAWIIGRVSMEPYAGKARVPSRAPQKRIPRTDFVGNGDARSYAIALDPSGKLTWTSNAIGDDHVIAILTEGVSDAYLAFLRSRSVSYVFGGKAKLNLKLVLEKLRRMFGIEKLLLRRSAYSPSVSRTGCPNR